MIVGIDFSINSTAMAIKEPNGNIELFSFVADYKKGTRKFRVHNELSTMVDVQGYAKCIGSEDDQTKKLRNADTLSELILLKLEGRCPQEIRMEGYSFGSKGNAFIDLITFNTFLKVKLIQKYGHVIKIIPPKSLKKQFCGNGNGTKCDMIRYFLQRPNLSLIDFMNKLVELNFIQENQDFPIPKPIDDVIDAIALVSIT